MLITPVMRRKFDESGKFVDQHGDYPGVVKEVAAAMQVMLIDLHRSSEALIVKEGVEGSRRLFLNIPPNHFKTIRARKRITRISVNMVQLPWLHWYAVVSWIKNYHWPNT